MSQRPREVATTFTALEIGRSRLYNREAYVYVQQWKCLPLANEIQLL